MGLIKILTDPGEFKYYSENQKGPINPNNVDPRTIPFGKDRPGGGNSGQPFYSVPIPEELTPNTIDFLYRGGESIQNISLTDKNRISQYFQTPSGQNFIRKQEILSKISPQTEASINYGQYNGGEYNFQSTLSQVLNLYKGEHLNKQGPFPQNNSNTLETYQNVIFQKQKNDTYGFVSSQGGFENRLLDFWSRKIVKTTSDSSLYQYDGGPGSDITGNGKTSIKFATLNDGLTPLRTGLNNINLQPSQSLPIFADKINDSAIKTLNGEIKPPLKLSTLLGDDPYLTDYIKVGFKSYELKYSGPKSSNDSNNVYVTREDGTVDINTPRDDINKYLTTGSRPSLDTNKTTLSDLTPLSQTNSYKTEGITSDTYTFSINNSVYQPNSRTPRSDIKSYKVGIKSRLDNPTETHENKNYGYLSNNLKVARENAGNDGNKDYVTFKIAITQGNGTAGTTYSFKSLIESFDDNYTANWKEQSYLGRAEKFYKYTDFGRDIGISFKVVSFKKEELASNFTKLNYIASSTAPTYTSQGYMAGNIAQITLGTYLTAQYGILKSVGYSIPDNSSWDITSELPLLIDVKLSFTPIHTFRPEIGKKFIQ